MSTKLEALKLTSGITMTVNVIADPQVRMVKGGTLKLTEFLVQDKNKQTIELAIFGDKGDKIKNGSTIKIIDANTNEYQGRISLSIPKWGDVEIVESD